MFSTIVNILLIILIFGILVLVHEFGHFIVAKLNHIRVDAFGLGFGPSILKRKIGETEYRLNVIPLGGYVQILGETDSEDGNSDDDKDPRNFKNKKVRQRIAVLIAGVAMNFILASVIYYILLASMGFKWYLPPQLNDFKPSFGTKEAVQLADLSYSDVVVDGNAKAAGIPQKGLINEVDGSKYSISTDLSNYIQSKKNQSINLKICNIDKKDECNNYDVKVSNEGKIGIMLDLNFLYQIKYTGTERVFVGFLHSLNQMKEFFYYFGQLFTTAFKTNNFQPIANSVSSPVGLYVVVDSIKKEGVLPIMELVANLSLTLVIMNLLPIPALDGGRVLLQVIEGARGKPMNKRVENFIIQGSFLLLMLLMLLIIFKDIFSFQQLQNMFK